MSLNGFNGALRLLIVPICYRIWLESLSPPQTGRELPGRVDKVHLHPSSAPEYWQSPHGNPGTIGSCLAFNITWITCSFYTPIHSRSEVHFRTIKAEMTCHCSIRQRMKSRRMKRLRYEYLDADLIVFNVLFSFRAFLKYNKALNYM